MTIPKRVVLLTNLWLVSRGGSEVVTRDLALGLLRRGHRPIVYSPELGEAARDITERGVPVIDDLRRLAEAPDIIHAHHSVPCGEALIRFPNVPAISVCHAFGLWMEAPVRFPQIAVYAAVDQACRDRLVHGEGLAPERVVVLPNAVDLARIPVRPKPLSPKPTRAIAFGKASAVPEIHHACDQAGIALTAIGYQGGQPIAHPERALVEADVVFATARAALEALCCGCVVIVCDPRGLAGIVTPENFVALRERNFGLRSLGEAVSVPRLLDELRRYDPVTAGLVSERAREAADLETHLDAIELLYDEVIAGSKRPRMTAEAHERAVAAFLHEYLPRRPEDPRWRWRPERQALVDEIARLERLLTEIMGERLSSNGEETDVLSDLTLQRLAGFDEQGYLERYPDVATAVSNGSSRSGLEHWLRYGRREGRLLRLRSGPRTADEP